MRTRTLVLFGCLVALVVSVAGSAGAAESWSFVYGEPDPDSFSTADGIAFGPGGELYVTGAFVGEFQGLSSPDEFRMFLMRISIAGVPEWVVSWTDADIESEVDWVYQDPHRRGFVGVDGAGTVWVSYWPGVAWPFDNTGASLGRIRLHTFGSLPLAVSSASAGGLIAVVSDDVTVEHKVMRRYQPDGTVDWEVELGSRLQAADVLPLDDGSAIAWFDSKAAQVFQRPSQTLIRVDQDGEVGYSVLYQGRCSGTTRSALDYARASDMFVFEGKVFVPSIEVTTGPGCTGMQEGKFAAYSLVTGELVDDFQVQDRYRGDRVSMCSGSYTEASRAANAVVLDPSSQVDCFDGGSMVGTGRYQWDLIDPTPILKVGAYAYGISIVDRVEGCDTSGTATVHLNPADPGTVAPGCVRVDDSGEMWPALVRFEFDETKGFTAVEAAPFAWERPRQVHGWAAGGFFAHGLATNPAGETAAVGVAGLDASIIERAESPEGRAAVLRNRLAAPESCQGLAADNVPTALRDVIVGTAGDDVLVGGGGNDLIKGLGGNDLICAGPGRDTVYGGLGNDTIYGGSGDDRLEGGKGRDRLFGERGNDTLIGGPGVDRAVGGAGEDTCDTENLRACEL